MSKRQEWLDDYRVLTNGLDRVGDILDRAEEIIAADNPIEQAALALQAARIKRDAARKALYDYRQQYGGCHVVEAGSAEHPCYRPVKHGQWCDACRNSQPLWEAYRSAANEVGAAMRKLMMLCGKKVDKGDTAG